MTAPTPEQRAAWRELATDLDQYAESTSDRDASDAILALLDALDAAERERDWLRGQAAQGVMLRNRIRALLAEWEATETGDEWEAADHWAGAAIGLRAVLTGADA